MKKPSKILFYTRPWEVSLHLEIARQLQKTYRDAPIVFATFFSGAAKQASAKGFEVKYLPKLLSEAKSNLASDNQIGIIDEQLIKVTGVGLNLMLQSERFLPPQGDAAIDFLRRHITVLDKIVEADTLSISSMFDHFVYWLGGALAHMRDGWHFAFVGTAVPGGRALALKTPWEHWQIPPAEDPDILLEKTQQSLKKPIEKRIEYMRPESKPSIADRLRLRLGWYRNLRTDYKAGSYFAQFSWKEFFFGSRLKHLNQRYPRPEYDISTDEQLETFTGPIYYLPLHMEPEATILMYSPWMRDQHEMCRLCSQALPTCTLLLVKENPKMNKKRPPVFYANLRALPNIRLVAPEVSSIRLIEKSKGVLTLAGSATLEASLMGRPGLAFGRPPFRRMLSKSDFTSSQGFSLDQLSSWMKNPVLKSKKEMKEEWAKWVTGTFPASVVPHRQGENFSIDSSPENAFMFCRYILTAITQQNR